jgi:membrane protein
MAARSGTGTTATTPTDIPRQGWKEIGKRVVGQLKAHHVSLLAAGVAFKALLALFPALIATVSIWGLVADPDTITEQISGMTDALPDEAAGLIESQLSEIAGQGAGALSGALIISILVALWSASAGMAGLMEGVNAAYREVDERPFPKKRGLALAFTLGAIVFLVVTIGILVVLPNLFGVLGLGDTGELAVRILQWPLLAALLLGALAAIYRYAPDRDEPQLRWATPGAILATVLWLVGSAGFTIYVETAGDFAATYGALAGVVILMLWLYLTAFSILLGAEVNATAEHQTMRDTTSGDPRPMGDRDAVVADSMPRRND